MTGRPAITVLVLAFDRTRFLPGALDSVLSQPGPGAGVEVLVVANVVDPATEASYAARGVRFLRSDRAELGAKVAEGIEAASGEVVAFLEDDDRFAPGKLAEVGRRFAEDPSLVFYHNNFRTIAPDEGPWTGPFHRAPAARRIARRRVYRPAGAAPGGWTAFRGTFPGFNNSCIAVRTDALRRWAPVLAGTDLASDEGLFLAAAASGGAILQDGAELTRLMVHPDSISNPSEGRRPDLARLAAFSGRAGRAMDGLRALAEASGRDDLRELAAAASALEDLVGRLRRASPERGPYARSTAVLLRRPNALATRNYPSVVLLGALGVLSPRVAGAIYRTSKALVH